MGPRDTAGPGLPLRLLPWQRGVGLIPASDPADQPVSAARPNAGERTPTGPSVCGSAPLAALGRAAPFQWEGVATFPFKKILFKPPLCRVWLAVISEECVISAKNVLIFYKTMNIRASPKRKATRPTPMPPVLRKVFRLHDRPQNLRVRCGSIDPDAVVVRVSAARRLVRGQARDWRRQGAVCEVRPGQGTHAPGTLPQGFPREEGRVASEEVPS